MIVSQYALKDYSPVLEQAVIALRSVIELHG
jgi:hypothetical protein